ncbi:hypothetical protein [Methanoregula boonei]|uniref:hypothetical protein n=1 Tax=Methanoregula boonei TaxID=358766 RepID=UPI0012F9BCE9|nr:hypothetical protein [Methanoregula boonei]
MDHQHTCETCGAFIPRTELLMPRCDNTGASPLSEPKIYKIRRQGCPVWSPTAE